MLALHSEHLAVLTRSLSSNLRILRREQISKARALDIADPLQTIHVSITLVCSLSAAYLHNSANNGDGRGVLRTPCLDKVHLITFRSSMIARLFSWA